MFGLDQIVKMNETGNASQIVPHRSSTANLSTKVRDYLMCTDRLQAWDMLDVLYKTHGKPQVQIEVRNQMRSRFDRS